MLLLYATLPKLIQAEKSAYRAAMEAVVARGLLGPTNLTSFMSQLYWHIYSKGPVGIKGHYETSYVVATPPAAAFECLGMN